MQIQEYFMQYALAHLTGSAERDASIRLKIDHSLRVCSLACALAAAEHFDEQTAELVRIASLLHDFGRFEQLKQFGTFDDAKSLDHGKFGADELEKLGVLRSMAECGEIISAVRFHNAYELPAELTGRARVLTMTVRDADKLDIFEVLLDHLAKPENPEVLWGMPLTGRLSPEVSAALLAGRNPPYCRMRNATDFLAGKLAWFREFHFDWSRAEALRRKYPDKLRRHLPQNAEMDAIFLRCVPLRG